MPQQPELLGLQRPIRLIESDAFPIEFLSTLAERESWRKEVYRPVYYLHKWWAKRLGSVFRGILLGCLLPERTELEKAFYQLHDFANVTVLDPFMGGGTTVGEAHKLGCIALGRDINPIACESVRVALGPLDQRKLKAEFVSLHATVGSRIQALYQVHDEYERLCDVLYFFWVKQIPCLYCGTLVDLFPTYVFARNAYPDRKPEVQVYCPQCSHIFTALTTDKQVSCSHCAFTFEPHTGPAKGAHVYCPTCTTSFSIMKAVQASGEAPGHRLYAKLILTPEGEKRYLAITQEDLRAYERCSFLLRDELAKGTIRLPNGNLEDGYNTRQAINYHYRQWRDFFNDRQLLALGWLHRAIADMASGPTRDAFFTLFSGTLEFNNLFASYKGEGTGAVRHMFSHHILKPERTPIEANVWGTSKSSGSFSNLYKLRMLRALEYRTNPFEVAPVRATITGVNSGARKIYKTSKPFIGQVVDKWPTTVPFEPGRIYLSCGSSDALSLPDRSIDFVITDPPFFDNVHYSELADFFYAWQQLYPHGFIQTATTTRDKREVQDTDPARFATKLRAVFRECCRVLKDDGNLVFTYHHSRAEGWASLAEAIVGGGFSIVNAHPVKAEMSVATPKSQTKEPIQLDIVLVCRKREYDGRRVMASHAATAAAVKQATAQLHRLSSIGLRLSRNDRRIVLISQFLVALGPIQDVAQALMVLRQEQDALEKVAEQWSHETPEPPVLKLQRQLFE